MSRRIVGPFNRVEGDLEIKLEIEDGAVQGAWVNSPLYRGFEQILNGKDPRDALVYTPRICGICSVSQSMAAATALALAGAVAAPANGRLMQNVILGVENVADHFTHFYLFFMPDFARPVYAAEPWYEEVAARFKAVHGAAAREILPVRSAFMHIMGTLAGHWPHTLGLQPGGTTHAIDGAAQARVLAVLAGFRRFLETRMFGDRLESVTALGSATELAAWVARPGPAGSDLGVYLRLAEALQLAELGRASDRFLSYGAYALNGAHLFKRGVHADGGDQALDEAQITEDTSSGWFVPANGPCHPSRGATIPDADAAGGYTWCKAPRLGGRVVEVGALARQLVDGHPLIRDLVKVERRQRGEPGHCAPRRDCARGAGARGMDARDRSARALLCRRAGARRGRGRRPHRGGARLARSLAGSQERAHLQLSDRGADHVELLPARCSRRARRLRAGARRRARARGRGRPGGRAAHRALVRSVHGVHGALREVGVAFAWDTELRNGGVTGVAIRVRGLVQGVGFRPNVWRLAQAFGLTGEVLNDGEGVLIRVWGGREALDGFERALVSEAPPLARVEAVERTVLGEGSAPEAFSIVASERGAIATGVAADAATCPACLDEVLDKAGRRYRYPFTNCTHCGPRLSIVRAIPYDRAATSMAAFAMCADCRAEYENPADRRFHAEPIACPVCGPRVWLEDANGTEIPVGESEDAVAVAARLIADGGIVAIKGIGGFHLACDAGNEDAVARLRSRKHRTHKPFALMAADADMIGTYAGVDAAERALLKSHAAPIVVLDVAQKLRPPCAELGAGPGEPRLHAALYAAASPADARSCPPHRAHLGQPQRRAAVHPQRRGAAALGWALPTTG